MENLQVVTPKSGGPELARRVWITTPDGVEYEISITDGGIKINRNDGGAIAIIPTASNCVEVRGVKR